MARTASPVDDSGGEGKPATATEIGLLRQQLQDLAGQLATLSERVKEMTRDVVAGERVSSVRGHEPDPGRFTGEGLRRDDRQIVPEAGLPPFAEVVGRAIPADQISTATRGKQVISERDGLANTSSAARRKRKGTAIAPVEALRDNQPKANQGDSGSRVPRMVRRWPKGCGRKPRDGGAEDALSRTG